MATMIPLRPEPDTKSAAERRLFSVFQNMPETEDWTIIHSVSLADHPTQSQGEADFVAVIPDAGVFVLEVKGGLISYEGGAWFSVDYYGEKHAIKNPVSEANNAMHAISDFVCSASAQQGISKCMFGFGVMFPDSEFRGKFSIPDLADKQIEDITNSDDMRAYFLELAAFWRSRLPRAVRPTVAQCKEIVNMLRPQYVANVSLATIIKNVEGQSVTLTENQKNVFEGLEDNERCLVRGSAGTGKTIIALQYANNLAAQGKSVAFFCYNRRLAKYLKENTQSQPNIICDSFTEYMESIALQFYPEQVSQAKQQDAGKYYSTILPELFSEAYLEHSLPPVEYLIVDEAQDLMTQDYLDAFDVMLQGELSGGNWYFFMDAESQNLYHTKTTYEDILSLLKQRHAFFAKYRLSDNCRNSAAIIKKVDSIFGTSTHYLHMEEAGADVKIKKYRKNTDEAPVVESIILEVLHGGVSPEKITVLSPLRLENSAVSLIANPSFSVSENPNPGEIMFCTIDGFKGLENSVVILTDIYALDSDKYMNRLYVGMTRAKSVLYVVASEKAVKTII